MKAVHVPEHRAFLRYLEIPGEGPTLLWLHGWQCSSTGELLPAAVGQPLRGRRSLLVDFLGHGYSDKPPDFGYELEDHARTIVALIDSLGLEDCGLVGHSMGGAIAILVAAARPAVISLLVLAEANVGPEGDDGLEGLSEEAFVEGGFPDQLASKLTDAVANPDGLGAAHLGITRLVEPRAVYREAVSMERERTPTLRSILGGLDMPRWYLTGELSDPDPEFDRGMAAMGVGLKVVPGTGHPMGLQNPEGLARTIADVIAASWSRADAPSSG
ncbi:MAG TPA: alpha/beta hydrolase [Candidatus Limnocylindrales bacterium]